MSNKYEESGVSLERGYESVKRIKKHVEATKNKGVMGNIGDFGGAFDLSAYNVQNPVLVSGTDGVGTKLLIAQELNIHNTIGIDLVAMCVNDIVTLGAKPLFFLDYIAINKAEPSLIESIIEGISEGLKISETALIGGETAEMPDLYKEDHYDLAGFTTGIVDKTKMLKKENVTNDDILIGLKSSGVHSNGFSLVRKVFFKDNNYNLNSTFEELDDTLGKTLLTPTKIYVKGMLELLAKINVHGVSHITGGGFIENIPRMLNEHQGVLINKDALPNLPIFNLIMKLGKIKLSEMYNIFNMGIGMVVSVAKEDVKESLAILNSHGYEARVIGNVNTSKKVEII